MKRIYLLPLPLLLAVTMTGCQPQPANTTAQSETGNGIEMVAGDIQIEAVKIIASDSAGGGGSVVAAIVNSGTKADTLQSITVEGKPAAMVPAGIEIPVGGLVSVQPGGDVAAPVETQAKPGEYVEVTFSFAESGKATNQVLIVPIGFYLPEAAQQTQPKPSESSEPGEASVQE